MGFDLESEEPNGSFLFQLPKQRKPATGTVLLFGCCKTQGLRTVTGILQASFTSWLLTILLGLLIRDTRSHPTDTARTEQGGKKKKKSDDLVFSSHVSIITSSYLVYCPHNDSSYSLGDSMDTSGTSIRAGEPEGIAV